MLPTGGLAGSKKSGLFRLLLRSARIHQCKLRELMLMKRTNYGNFLQKNQVKFPAVENCTLCTLNST